MIACSAVLVPLAISLLKQRSNAHCPWDLARYGGSEPYVRLSDALPPGALVMVLQARARQVSRTNLPESGDIARIC